MRHLLLPAVLLLLLLLLGGRAAAEEGPGTRNELVGRPVGSIDSLQWMTADGKPFRFADQPFTLLRWWTNRCPHCTASLPALAQLERKYAARGLRFVAVYHPKGRDLGSERNMRAYLGRVGAGRQGAPVDVAYDPRWIKLKDLMARGKLTRATSVSFLVDRAGVVRWVHPGPRIYETKDPAWAHAGASLRELDTFLSRVLPRRAARILQMRKDKAWTCAPDGGDARALALAHKPDDTPVWDPAGRRVAYATSVDGQRRVVVSAPSGAVRLFDPGVGDARIDVLRWSPNGTGLLLQLGFLESEGCRVFRLDIDTGRVRPTARAGRGEKDIAACWGPASRSLAIVTITKAWDESGRDATVKHFDAAIDVVDLRTGKRRRVVQPEKYVFDVAWAPDGRTLAYGTAHGLRLVDATGRNRRVLSKDNISPQPLWSPDGAHLLVAHPSPGDFGPTTRLPWDLALYGRDGRRVRQWRARGTIFGAAWSPSGRSIAFVREDRLLRVPAAGGEPVRIAAGLDIFSGVSWR